MTKQLIVIGAGGLGRETHDAAVAAGWEVVAFADAPVGETVHGLPVMDEDRLPAGAWYAIGIADPATRARVSAKLDTMGLRPATILHPRATIGPETTLGEGTVVMANAYISSSVTMGRHCHVNYNATVGHDALLGDFCSLYPGSNLSGYVSLGASCTLGSNAVVIDRLEIGADTFIGAGAVVIGCHGGGGKLVGNPARHVP